MSDNTTLHRDQIPSNIAAARALLIGSKLTIPDAAKALNCCLKTVRNLMDRHRIPYVKINGRVYLEPTDLLAAIEKTKRNAPSEPRGRGRPIKGG